jgi:hypothetical protein
MPREDLASFFEAVATEVVEARGPAPIKPTKAKPTRAVKVVGETGEVKRVVSHASVLESLLVRHGLEDAVVEGKRPARVLCAVCRKVIKVKPGPLPKWCSQKCRDSRGARCKCGAPMTRGAQQCWKCHDPGEAGRKGQAARTPEQRIEAGRKAHAAMTPEQRSEAARRANAARTPEQRIEIARKREAAKTSEQRSEAARERLATMTPEQRSEATRKAWETRRSSRRASDAALALEKATDDLNESAAP